MCIATATDKHLVEAALKRCGISRYFSEIFTCISVGYGKDEPVIYREAWKYRNTNKSGTVVFEVAVYAVKTAKNDGFITVATFDRHEKCQDEIKALSDYYMTHYLNIKNFWKFASAI